MALRSSHLRVGVGILVAALGLYLGARALIDVRAGARASGSVGSETVPAPQPNSDLGAPEFDYAPVDRNEIAASVRDATLARPELSGEMAEALAEIVADAFVMYDEGTIEAYDRYIAERGLEPSSGWESAKASRQDSLELKFEFLRGAEVAARESLVRQRSAYPDHQHEQEPAPIGHGMTEASIPERAVKGVPVYEIVLPARTWSRKIHRSPAGSLEIGGGLVRVDGRVALLLQWDEESRSWTPIALRAYGESHADSMPILPQP